MSIDSLVLKECRGAKTTPRMVHYLTRDGLLLGTAEHDDPHEVPRYSTRLPPAELDAISTALATAHGEGLLEAGDAGGHDDADGAVLSLHVRMGGGAWDVPFPRAPGTLLWELVERVLRHVPVPYERGVESLFPAG